MKPGGNSGPPLALGDVSRFIHPDNPLSSLAEFYLQAILVCDRRRAHEAVLAEVDQGLTIRDVYLHVLQPVQYEIGRLWARGEVSTGLEHYCTSATQLLMATLYPRLFERAPGERRMLAACVEGELHEIGLRMLADFFEMDGWNTEYLGANTPVAGVVDVLGIRRPQLVAIGITIHRHLEKLPELIKCIRESAYGRDIPILVGGNRSLQHNDLWKELGADGTAPDAATALKLANRLVPLSVQG